VSVRTVQLWVEDGVLQGWRTAGGHRRIPRQAVDDLLRSQGRPSTEAGGERRAVDAASDQGLRLLIVEDDPQLLKLYERQIAALGLDVEIATASNGFAGLLEIGRRQPDLVLADLAMLGLDGFQMIQAIKNHADYEHTVIVVMTGVSAEDIASRGGVPEGVQVLRKPVTIKQLDQLLRDELQRKAWM